MPFYASNQLTAMENHYKWPHFSEEVKAALWEAWSLVNLEVTTFESSGNDWAINKELNCIS